MMHADEDSTILDLHGNHAAACPSTFRARYYTHSKLENVVAAYCKEVEMCVQLEPTTESVLAFEYDKKQCRHLFQRAPSVQTQARSSALLELYNEMQNPRTSQTRIDELAKAADLLIRQIPTDANGLRLDVFASQSDGGGTSLLIDVAQSHDTKTSGRAKMLHLTFLPMTNWFSLVDRMTSSECRRLRFLLPSRRSTPDTDSSHISPKFSNLPEKDKTGCSSWHV